MPSPYDRILYAGLPFSQTHPDRLASLATLFGMQPAPIDHCRVLELACANGGNLIPMACDLPGSQFVGIDIALTGIQSGRDEITDLGLTNIRLEHMDIMDAGPGLGTFDYIIAHGLYSWVPEQLRDKLLAIAKANLAPEGVAYISYNALPGCRVREMFRDMLLFHVRGLSEPEARVESARGFLECVVASQDAQGPAGMFLKSEAQCLIDKRPDVLFHDELAETYHAVFFHDFVAHASRHGLQFLSEAAYVDMQERDIPGPVVAQAERFSGGNRILRDQYFDFFKGRTFRQTLLCHTGIAVPDQPQVDRVRRLSAASQAQPVSAEPDLGAGVVEEFRGVRGAAVKTAHPLVKATMTLLGKVWPEAMPFERLLASAGQLIAEQPNADDLAGILLVTYAAGLIELHSRPPRCVSKVSRFPAVTDLARWRASHEKLIVTARHALVEASGETERRLVALLDGTHDLAALTREMAAILNKPEETVATEIEGNLVTLARLGLLVA
jgi:methyltransferase-like protein